MTSLPSETLPTIDPSANRVIVDSNLLLLLVVGLWNPAAISGLKRLSGLSFVDFDLLRTFLLQFSAVVTTAHILTEGSNLAGSASGEGRKAIFFHFAQLIQTLDERAIASKSLSTTPEFHAFGLTDSALSTLCSEIVLVTQDGRLASHLQRRGLRALTLDHVRALREQANHG